MENPKSFRDETIVVVPGSIDDIGGAGGQAVGSIKMTEKKEEFATGAHRNSAEGKGDFSLIPPGVEYELAQHYQSGAMGHGRNNWKKGIKTTRLYDSARRHLNVYAQGDRSEPHLIAAIWNIIGIWYNEKKYSNNPEVHDIQDFQ